MSRQDRDKRRQRKTRSFTVSSKPRWLICCEGKSEVIYLRALVEDLAQGLPHNIHFGEAGLPCGEIRGGMCGACGRQGQAIVDRAETCARGKFYDKVWVVFDEDGETINGAQADKRKDFSDTISKWSRTEPGERSVEIAWNKPKFENWLLFSKEGLSKSGIDKAEEDVKDVLYRYYEVDPSRGPVPKAKQPYIKKPYPKSYQVFGGLEGAKTAARVAKNNYIANGITEIEKSGGFDGLPCGSSFFRLIQALFQYFGQST